MGGKAIFRWQMEDVVYGKDNWEVHYIIIKQMQ